MSLNKQDKDNINVIMRGNAVESAKKTDEFGSQLGKTLADKGLKTSQIRAVFGQVRRIEMAWQPDEKGDNYRRQVILLKSKLAYQSARIKEVGMLKDILAETIDLIDNREHFQRFVDFFEAILAYHKASGGKD
jgi:CRISPR-associated protein Csm2